MKRIIIYSFTPFLFTLFSFSAIYAQNAKLTLNRTEIGANEMLELALTVTNERLQNYSNFPDINGFTKRGKSNSTRTNIVNGQITQSQTITQNYSPNKQGTFTIPAFTMTVNGKKVDFPGATIKVGKPVNKQRYDPFAEFWNFGKEKNDQQFVTVKEDAFFAITTSKRDVYVGEGFTMNIAFYISLKNRAKMDFYKISDQLAEILKKVRPANCWEENFGIDQITPEYVTVNGQQYQQYKIYQATFYPLNDEDIKIPSTSLKMIKYNVAKRPSFFGQNMQEDYKEFYSQAKTVKVNPLPPHPLRDMVNVGIFKLDENISSTQQETGQSFIYNFAIRGEGNISAVKEINLPEVDEFDFYPPNITQQVNRGNDVVYGSKAFKYNVEPREPGSYALGDYFSWVFFNPKTEEYDTLRSNINLEIIGESKKNMEIASSALSGFYQSIEDASNTLYSTNKESRTSLLTNIGLGLIMATAIFFVLKKQ